MVTATEGKQRQSRPCKTWCQMLQDDLWIVNLKWDDVKVLPWIRFIDTSLLPYALHGNRTNNDGDDDLLKESVETMIRIIWFLLNSVNCVYSQQSMIIVNDKTSLLLMN